MNRIQFVSPVGTQLSAAHVNAMFCLRLLNLIITTSDLYQ